MRSLPSNFSPSEYSTVAFRPEVYRQIGLEKLSMTRTMQRKARRQVLSSERVARLHRLVQLLGAGPKTREMLVKNLKVETRSFYRDCEKMRRFGVAMEMLHGRYVLTETVVEALSRLPFPDPGLSVQEALLLSRGKTSAHKKLRRQIEDVLGK